MNESSPPSCFVVPRWTPDGKRNEGFRIMRLKDKLADRANASSEVEYDNAYGILISEPGDFDLIYYTLRLLFYSCCFPPQYVNNNFQTVFYINIY